MPGSIIARNLKYGILSQILACFLSREHFGHHWHVPLLSSQAEGCVRHSRINNWSSFSFINLHTWLAKWKK